MNNILINPADYFYERLTDSRNRSYYHCVQIRAVYFFSSVGFFIHKSYEYGTFVVDSLLILDLGGI